MKICFGTLASGGAHSFHVHSVHRLEASLQCKLAGALERFAELLASREQCYAPTICEEVGCCISDATWSDARIAPIETSFAFLRAVLHWKSCRMASMFEPGCSARWVSADCSSATPVFRQMRPRPGGRKSARSFAELLLFMEPLTGFGV